MQSNNLKFKTLGLCAVVLSFSIFVFSFVAAPVVFAQAESTFEGTLDKGLFDLEKVNPLRTTSVVKLLERIIDVLTLYIAAPVAVLMVIVGAFQMLSAGGNPERFATGRKTILYAAIGFAVLLAADLLIGLAAEILGVKPEFIPK